VIESEGLDQRTQAVVDAISAPRLGPYLAVADGNTREARRVEPPGAHTVMRLGGRARLRIDYVVADNSVVPKRKD